MPAWLWILIAAALLGGGAVVVARRRAAAPRPRAGAGSPAVDPTLRLPVVDYVAWARGRPTVTYRDVRASAVATHYRSLRWGQDGRVVATYHSGRSGDREGPPVIALRERGEFWEVGGDGGVVAAFGDAIKVGVPLAAGAVATVLGGPEAGALAAAGAGALVAGA